MIYGVQKKSSIKMANASISDIKFYPDTEMDKVLTARLTSCDFIDEHLNIICIGAGKSYCISALGNETCKKAKVTRYIRLPDLLYELEQARKKDTYKKRLQTWSKIELLIIDEFLLTETTEQQKDIWELLELRYETHSTIFALQFLSDGWHKQLGRALADAILDRVAANSYQIHIKGNQSMRTRKE